MSTNFLNRRMDLSHYILDNYNILEMDTSYPVKLAGKVIKLFNATADFDTEKGYKLFNSDKELILDIITDNVYDFAGRVIKNNVGDDCVYPLVTDVYKENDYVMAVIDFDNNKILLCSQTNFESMVGAGEGRVRIFTLDGNKEPTEYDIGIEYPYDEDVFDNAAKFEAMDGRDALAKFTTDQVLYETPVSEWYDSHRKDRTMIPVAKTEVSNIGNKLTARINKFMFAYLDNLGGDFGVSYVNKIAAFVQIFGSFNTNFINTFCMTESEMLNCNLINTANSKMKKSMLEEYYNIPDSYKNKYRYILMCNTDTDNFEIDKYNDSMKFIPFDVDNCTFPSLFMLNNRGFVVDGESVELPGYLDDDGNDYVGQLAYNDARQGYNVLHYSTMIDILMPRYDNDDNLQGTIIDSTISTGDKPVLYTSPQDTINMTGIQNNNLTKDDFSTYLAPINKFMNFFLPESYRQIISANKDLDDNIYKHILAFQSSTNVHTHSYTLMGSDELANTVVIEYPEIFEDKIEDGTTDITNYTMSIGSGTFKRKGLTFDNRVSPNNYDHLEGVIFKLFNTKATNTYIESTNGGKYANMTYTADEITEPTKIQNNKYRFLSTRNLSSVSDANNILNKGIFVSNDKSFVFAPICIVSMNTLGVKKGVEIDYNPVEVTANNIVVVKKIKRAKAKSRADVEYISYCETYGEYDTPYLCYTDESGVQYPLYMVSKVEDGDTLGPDAKTLTLHGNTFVLKMIYQGDTSIAAGFKMPYTNWEGNFLYLYYISYDGLHRIKYHYRGTNRDIGIYDYFTDNIVLDRYIYSNMSVTRKWSNPSSITEYDLDVLDRMNKNTIYLKAYINAKAQEEYNRDTLSAIRNTTAEDISWDSLNLILYVAAYYGLYTSINTNPSPDYGNDSTLIKASSKLLSTTSNFNLTVGIDEIIIFPGTNNNKNIYGIEGIRMSDMFKSSNVTIPKNMMTPIVSDKIDANGGYVYNIGSYLSKAANTNNSIIGGGSWKINNINKTININGIKGEKYYDSSNIAKLLDFYRYALSCDLDSTTQNQYFDKVEIYDRILFKRYKILHNELKFMVNQHTDDLDANATWDLYDKDNNKFTLKAESEDGFVLHTNIDPKNIMGISQVTIHKMRGTDHSSIFIDSSAMSLVNTVTTGKKTTYSLSLNDSEDSIEHNMIALDGSSDIVSVDEINAQTLLKSISGNKSIDVLSYSLKTIKNILNSEIIDSIQNISDTVTMKENKTTIETANRTDAHPHADSSGMQPYLIPEGSTWADFNSDLCLYKFHYAYGYLSPAGQESVYNEHRILNNRGVIVFVTENGDSYRQAGSGGTYNSYSNRVPDIRPKRMYINNDGILCTKEYFDREEAIFNNGIYPHATSLAELRNSINNLLTRVNDLTNRIEAIEEKLPPDEP